MANPRTLSVNAIRPKPEIFGHEDVKRFPRNTYGWLAGMTIIAMHDADQHTFTLKEAVAIVQGIDPTVTVPVIDTVLQLASMIGTFEGEIDDRENEIRKLLTV